MLGPAEGLRVQLVDVLRARRPRREPAVRGRPPSGRRSAPRCPAPSSARRDRLARPARVAVTCSGRQLAQHRLLLRRRRRVDPRVQPAPRTAPSGRRNRDRVDCPVTAVISAASRPRMMPSLSVVHTVPSRRRNDAPALSSPPKPSDPSSSPGTNHLNPTGTSSSLPAQVRRHAVDHRAADQRLAHRRVGRPAVPVLEQVLDGDGQVVVGVHQPAVGRHDAVPVGVGVVAERHVELVLSARSGRPSRTATSSPCGSCRPSRGS